MSTDDAHEAMLARYARGDLAQDLLDAWPAMRPRIHARIRDNVAAFDARATPQLHAAAPVADALRAEPHDATHPSGALELAMSEHSVSADDMRDFYPARMPPPEPAWPTWDVVLEDRKLEQVCAHVCAMVDEFADAPPFTIQRVAELLLEPKKHYHTRSKYLAALCRTLGVTAVATPHRTPPQEPPQPHFALRTKSESQLFHPLPFAEDVPAGRIDEVDVPTEHGAVGDAHPLTATQARDADASERARLDTP